MFLQFVTHAFHGSMGIIRAGHGHRNVNGSRRQGGGRFVGQMIRDFPQDSTEGTGTCFRTAQNGNFVGKDGMTRNVELGFGFWHLGVQKIKSEQIKNRKVTKMKWTSKNGNDGDSRKVSETERRVQVACKEERFQDEEDGESLLVWQSMEAASIGSC